MYLFTVTEGIRRRKGSNLFGSHEIVRQAPALSSTAGESPWPNNASAGTRSIHMVVLRCAQCGAGEFWVSKT